MPTTCSITFQFKFNKTTTTKKQRKSQSMKNQLNLNGPPGRGGARLGGRLVGRAGAR